MKTTTASDLLSGKATIEIRGSTEVCTQDGEALVLQVPSLPCVRVETHDGEVAVHLRVMDEDGLFINKHAARVCAALEDVVALAAERLDPHRQHTWVPAIRDGVWRVAMCRTKKSDGCKPTCPVEGAWPNDESPTMAAFLLRCDGVWEGLGRMGVAWTPVLVRFESGQ